MKSSLVRSSQNMVFADNKKYMGYPWPYLVCIWVLVESLSEVHREGGLLGIASKPC